MRAIAAPLCVPPRWQRTTSPRAAPAGSLDPQKASSPVMFSARTTDIAVEIPFVSVTPGMSNVAPPCEVRCSVDVKNRGPVEAPTVVVQGPPWSDVAEPGPLLPAEALTEMPALTASRKASSTGSVYGCAPPEIEKLSTLTPFAIACCTAATESELKQPLVRQKRYSMTCAPGAMPQTGPRSTPYSIALVTQSPAAVVIVWVP